MLSTADAVSSAPIVVIGRAGDLSTAISCALEGAGMTATFVGGPLPSPDAGQRGPELDDVPSDAEAVVVLVDHDAVVDIVGGYDSWWKRRANRTREGDICGVVTDAVLGIGGRRLLVLCDGREITSHQRSRVIRWVRQLTLRIHYECSINGLDGLAIAYEVVVDDAEVQRVARSVVQWHLGVTGGTPNPVAPH
ncbi:hypothetical protein A5727_05820 [Mycobacterium sp. ACS4331]|nr:hypothetical protein A5727_05820 [Mycobacterium sp. ACS4331]